MFAYFPGYGWLGPSFDGRRSLIPGVMPVFLPSSAAPAHPQVAGGSSPGAVSPAPGGVAASGLAGSGVPSPGAMTWAPAPAGVGLTSGGTQKLRAPLGGGPLAALAGTPLGPALAQLLAARPDILSYQPGALPPEIPGMPAMPQPPPGMFDGTPAGRIGQPAAPPSWTLPVAAASGWSS